MATWNTTELATIAATREVEISSLGEDGSLTKPVTHHLDEEIDAAYKVKYGYPSSPVDSITTDAARATTMRVVPR
jgi:hypothetical protein